MNLKKQQNQEQREFIRIKKNRRNAQINGKIKVFSFIDSDTNQFVEYIPSLEISAYGESKSKVKEMLHVALEDFAKYIFSLSIKKVHAELSSLGWKQETLASKNYSHCFIDKDGVLRNFNVENVIEEELKEISI